MLCRPNDNERQEDCSQPFDGGSETSGPTESRGGSANLQDLTDLRRDGVHDLPVRQSERPQAVAGALKELYVIPIGRIGRLHGSEWYEQTGCHGFGRPHVGLPKLIVAGAIVFATALVKLIGNPPSRTWDPESDPPQRLTALLDQLHFSSGIRSGIHHHGSDTRLFRRFRVVITKITYHCELVIEACNRVNRQVPRQQATLHSSTV